MSKIEKILQYRKSLIEVSNCLVTQLPNMYGDNFEVDMKPINHYFDTIGENVSTAIHYCNNAIRSELGLPSVDYWTIPDRHKYVKKLCASSDKGVKEKLSYYLQIREKVKEDSDYLELINKDIQVLLCI